MIPVTTRSAEHVAVFGLGASGRAAALALAAGGARVTAWDDDAASREAAANENIPLSDLGAVDWGDISTLVLSPGVPLTHPAPHPVVRDATNAGISIVGDIELLAEACPDAILVGITGTNGKSTTAALLHHIFREAETPVQIGGNFGPPVLGLDTPAPGQVIVLELSSYQLDLTARATVDVAVLLNVTPDHLDRHGDMAGYIAAKKRIFRTADTDRRQTAIVGVDDDDTRAVFDELTAAGHWTVLPISVGQALEDGVYVIDGLLHDAQLGVDCDLTGMETLRGRHNWQNAAAAWAAARARGIPPETIAAALATYPGLPHRMETVASRDGIRYVNDSKATNGEAAARALASYDDIYWIAGGIAKEDGLAPTAPYMDRVRRAYLIGEAAPAFADALKDRVEVSIAGDLETALEQARRDAEADNAPAPVILLSPACASFDQFRNFAIRGDRFRELVASLTAGETP